jgi:hypothetical protein
MKHVWDMKCKKMKKKKGTWQGTSTVDSDRQETDPTSRQRGRSTETRQQISDRIIIWSQVPQWARHQDVLTDWPLVVTWLHLQLQSDISGLHVVGRPPLCEDGPVIYSYNLLSLSGPSHAELMTISYCLIWSRSRSYFTTDSQSANMSWYRVPLWDLWPDITSCRNIAVWNLLSFIYWAPSLTRGQVCNLQCNHSIVRVAQNPKPYFTVSSETPSTWKARFPYLYPPGTGWPSCTPGHWVSHLRLLGSPFMASSDSQGYGGGILTRLPHVECLDMLWERERVLRHKLED